MTELTSHRWLVLLLATMALCTRGHTQISPEVSQAPWGAPVSAPASAPSALPSPVLTPGAAAGARPETATAPSAIPSGNNGRTPITAPALIPSGTPAALAHSGTTGIPRNLFQLPHDAMVNVHGKPMRAGEVQRRLNAVLSRAPRGTPSVFRYPRARQGGSTPEFNRAALPRFDTAALGGGRASDLVRAPSGMSPAGAMRPKPCSELTPEVARTQGAAEAGRSFVIEGYCLGDRPGSVELIGPFRGGSLQPAFQVWTEERIVAVMPSLRGVPDQGVALVVTRSDNSRSSAYPVRFIAQRERIEVPPGLWSPDGNVDQTVATQDSGNLFTGFTATGTPGVVAGNFSLHVSPQCALDNLEIATTAGGVLSVTDFEDGAPNEANITVTYGPNCSTHTFDYLFGSESSTVCRVAFQLHAWANCPAGVPP